jgi:hypothetical protein
MCCASPRRLVHVRPSSQRTVTLAFVLSQYAKNMAERWRPRGYFLADRREEPHGSSRQRAGPFPTLTASQQCAVTGATWQQRGHWEIAAMDEQESTSAQQRRARSM